MARPTRLPAPGKPEHLREPVYVECAQRFRYVIEQFRLLVRLAHAIADRNPPRSWLATLGWQRRGVGNAGTPREAS